MRNRSLLFATSIGPAVFAGFLAAACIYSAVPATAAGIEAVQGKTYGLSSKHGPWMIMVTSLWGATPEQEEQAVKAAGELVYQLRKKGVPAYTYQQDDQIEEIDSIDRTGRRQQKKITARHGMIAVLAGNYKNPDDKVAQQTLKFVKKFSPKVTVDWQGKQMTIPLVLSNAFMTRNPMLPAEELAKKNVDPLIVKLNSGDEHSLFQNPGKYTLVVASFYGKSQVKPVDFARFDRMLQNKRNISLDDAGRDSWELMTLLRKQGYDAYVYHERFRSIVTIGAFKSPKDPDIARLAERCRAKEKLNPETKQVVLVAEAVQIPGRRKNAPPLKSFVLDPNPELMQVPR